MLPRDIILERVARAPELPPGLRSDYDLNPGTRPEGPLTPAAVLVPLVLRPEEPTVLLTLRTDHLHDHAGQISFPGGRIEEQDETPEACALRETQEEVGLDPDKVQLIGRLDTYVVRTGFEITPTVGFVSPPFEIDPDPFEVAEVFEVPISFFMDRSNHRRGSRMYKGSLRHFYVMEYGDRYIWGATAAMLVNLVDILEAP